MKQFLTKYQNLTKLQQNFTYSQNSIDKEYNKRLDRRRPCFEDDITAGSNLLYKVTNQFDAVVVVQQPGFKVSFLENSQCRHVRDLITTYSNVYKLQYS